MHEIDMSNSRANIAFVGETPWHGLGTELDPTADIETWREQAGLGFKVLSAPVRFNDESDVSVPTIEFPERVVLYRSDTKTPLSVVSDQYRVVQPAEVLDFIAQCVKSAGFQMEVAGSLQEGRKVWALARVNDGAPVVGHDVVRPYLLAATSYDATMSTTFKFTGIRVVCNNTITMAAGGAGEGVRNSGQIERDKTEGAVVQCVRVPHSATPDFKAIRQQLGVVLTAWDRFLVDARLLADTPVSNTFAKELLISLLAVDRNNAESRKAAAELRAFKQMMALFTGEIASPTTPEAEGTAWGLLNAVTFHVDHLRGGETTRLNSAWFGSGEGLKNKARELLLEAVE